VADNVFDSTSRYVARRSGAPLLLWFLSLPADVCRFVGWLQTTLVVPGQPERVADTIAHVQRLDQGGAPWAVPVEFQSEPHPLMFGRLLVYEGLLWQLEKPTELTGDRFQLQTVLVHLTGSRRVGQRMVWREGAGTSLEPIEWHLETLNAAEVLDQVARGLAPRAVLVWISLMQQGDEEGIIQRWLELANAETDVQWKADLALVLVFAELAGRREVWGRALEGYNVKESAVVNEWKAEARAEGKAEGKAEAVCDLLEERFGALPEEVRAKIRANRAGEVLRRWLLLAARADTLEQFRQEAGI
jgi:hypothetical protein